MRRRRKPAFEPSLDDVEAALATMDADTLREVVCETLLELDERAHARVVSSVIRRAARGGSGWAPAAVSNEDVVEVLAFADAAKRVGYANPSDIDERLRRGTGAFLRKNYCAAYQIFGALLVPMADLEIDLGQHELVDEMLCVDPSECATQYVVSAYMAADPRQRAEAVRTAIREVHEFGGFSSPIQQMERAAVEPLHELDDFLPRWQAIVAEEAAGDRACPWGAKSWLREVVGRIDGVDGLARIARSTRHADLRAWCERLVESGDWKAALHAYEQAAQLVADTAYARGEFLDGAALAAQELGKKNLSPWLGRAWRGAPSMLRLRRWLGAARSTATVRKRAAEALQVCPKQDHRQRAFLHLLLREFEPAAKYLAAAPGLGWSNHEHPGHLIFPLFQALLGGGTEMPELGTDLDEFGRWTASPDEPRLVATKIAEILRQAGIDRIADAKGRSAVLRAMRTAAEKRLRGVTDHKRRRHYGHAASLVVACLSCDLSSSTRRWVNALRTDYRRYYALVAEFDDLLGPS